MEWETGPPSNENTTNMQMHMNGQMKTTITANTGL